VPLLERFFIRIHVPQDTFSLDNKKQQQKQQKQQKQDNTNNKKTTIIYAKPLIMNDVPGLSKRSTKSLIHELYLDGYIAACQRYLVQQLGIHSHSKDRLHLYQSLIAIVFTFLSVFQSKLIDVLPLSQLPIFTYADVFGKYLSAVEETVQSMCVCCVCICVCVQCALL